MTLTDQFPPFQGDSASAICLICRSRFVHNADLISRQSVFAEILTDLFHMFLNDLKWDLKDGMDFNFEKEAFPFCECCRIILLNLRSLRDQVDNLTKQIHQIVANINAKILMSGTDIENNKGSESELGGEFADQSLSTNVDNELVNGNSSVPQETTNQELTKIQRFRKRAFKYYMPEVSIGTELKKIANDHLALLHSKSSVNNALNVPEDSVNVASIDSGRVSPQSLANDFALDVEDIKPKGDVNHDIPPMAEPEKSHNKYTTMTCVRKQGKILYQNEFLVEKIHGILYCRSCPFTSEVSKYMKRHVWKAHVEKKKVRMQIRVIEIGNRLYQYGKYIFEKLKANKFQCKTCGNIRKSSLGIRCHIRETHCVAARGKQYTCEVCGKGFYWLYHLQQHAAVHGDIRSHVCEVCGESFKHYSALFRHKKKVHEGVRKVPTIVICDVCGKRISKVRLQDHMNNHTGEKPYKCHICNKSFGSSMVLTTHQKVHKPKNYSCDICGMTFTQSGSVKRHKGTAHP